MKKILPFLLFISLTAAACTFSTPAENQADQGVQVDNVATSVAATLNAQESGEAPQDAAPEEPAPVPDLLQIAYTTNGGEVWLWTEGAGSTEVSLDHAAYDVRISDDGQVIAFLTHTADGSRVTMWSVNADGSSLQELVSADTFSGMMGDQNGVAVVPHTWEFIPGTHTVAFNTRIQYEGPGLAIQKDLRLANADTATLTILLDVDQGGQFYYSPDGSQIALTTPTDISLIHADGSNRRSSVVRFESVITYSEGQYYPRVRWAQDSSKLWAAIPSPDILAPDRTVEVFEILTDGSPGDSLGKTAGNPPYFSTDIPISPDLTTLAVLRQPNQDNNVELHFAKPATGELSLYLAGGFISFEGWSPDSSHFSFKMDNTLYIGQLGGGYDLLSGITDAQNMQWVSGTQYLYFRYTSDTWELWLGSLDSEDIFLTRSNEPPMMTFDFRN